MLTAYYDLATSPPTYDIVAFLVAAERYRLAMRGERLAIHVVPGPVGGFRNDRLWPHTIAGREQMLHQVALPMARMLRSATVALLPGRPHRASMTSIGLNGRCYGTALLVECLRQGIRPLRPAAAAPRDPRLVTITLREAEHWTPRNSNVPQWIAAGLAIADRGYQVIVVRDTLQADQPIDGLATSARAAIELEERAMLYRRAACNLFVNNGPAWLALALDAPVLMLKPTVEGLMATCSNAYLVRCGIAVGGQIPGSPSYQRIAWHSDDSAAEILGAFDDFMVVQS